MRGEGVGTRGLVSARCQRREKPARLGRRIAIALAFQFTPGLLRRVALIEDAVLHAERVGLRDQRFGRDEVLLRHGLPCAAEKIGGLLTRIRRRTVRRIRLSQDRSCQPRFRRAIHGPRYHGSRRKNQCQRDPTDKCVCCRFQQSSPCETHPFCAGVFSRAGHRRRPSSRSNPEIPVDEDGLNSRRRPTGQEQFREIRSPSVVKKEKRPLPQPSAPEMAFAPLAKNTYPTKKTGPSRISHHGGVDIPVCRERCGTDGRQECLPHRRRCCLSSRCGAKCGFGLPPGLLRISASFSRLSARLLGLFARGGHLVERASLPRRAAMSGLGTRG